MFDREIDRTIDDVARELTAGETASDFRARVLARTEARREYPLLTWHPRMIAAAAVALIVVVVAGAMAVMLLRTRITETTTTQATTSTATTTMAASSAPRDVPAPVTRAHRPPRAIDITPSDVVALAPPPLGVESIVLGELDPPPSIEIERLETIASIAIVPLGEDGQKQGDRP